MAPFQVLPAALVLVAAAGTAEAAGTDAARGWLVKQGYAPPSEAVLVGCHGYGCTRRFALSTGSGWFDRVAAILRAGRASPAAERRALGEAMRIYTATLAARAGGRRDVPRSPPGLSGVSGQMDCLDTTANTTSLLLVLQERGLLAFHRIDGPESRGVFLDGRYPHFTAVIAETSGSGRWVVDPWTRAPGQLPDIMPLERWRRSS
jgi:hypothetical protein